MTTKKPYGWTFDKKGNKVNVSAPFTVAKDGTFKTVKPSKKTVKK